MRESGSALCVPDRDSLPPEYVRSPLVTDEDAHCPSYEYLFVLFDLGHFGHY